MNTKWSALLLTCLLLATSAFAADYDTDAGLFAKGKRQVTVLGGTGSAFDDSYFVIGAGANYYVMDGLNVGGQLEAWTGGDPGIFKVTASTTYVVYQSRKVFPYFGAFVRYTDIEDHDSLYSVGGRAGIYLALGGNGYAGIGGVYESYLSCDAHTYLSCHSTYPEVSVAFGF